MELQDRENDETKDVEMSELTRESKPKEKRKKSAKRVPDAMELVGNDGDNGDDHDDQVVGDNPGEPDVYVPGQSRPLMDDEMLVMDKSSYRLFHEFQLESASLSFDILLDNLGNDRSVEVNGPPVSACLIAGTQAYQGGKNHLVLLRLGNMLPFRKKIAENPGEEEEDSDEDSSDDDENLDAQPELEAATIEHSGTVNRVRAHQHAGRYFAASWSELGKVFIWDLTRPLTAVNDSAVMTEYARRNESPAPVFAFKGHRNEGFALDWSSNVGASGHLASGDCEGHIYHWVPRTSGWLVQRTPYTGHTGSVEDIQWSYSEPTVFLSVSADHSIRVWDVRSPPSSGSMLTVPDAHPSDVNVAAWNRQLPVQLLTGGDDGSLRVWDLRQIHRRYGATSDGQSMIPAYTHVYNFHKKPITSVEWNSNDPGVFVATSEDDQVTLWDTTLEQAEIPEDGTTSNATANLPVQLLFIHSGQTEVKESHWHPQIPGLLFTTALNGFNVFRTCNI
ncbi:Glutamate-rich WD repeat containing [Fasciolopsis buskii]|uniref:Glutamate-rich WD repeat-containing protein 1 n=1 Tax=Fasciolopsis buskii TaxID=27845 RepID=A0A8E0VJ23_9TREM|nr:Glutamate-rich WD repeat containing [Fasciolopsis buski]